MEPYDPATAPGTIDNIVTILGGIAVAIIAWLGKNRKPDKPEPTAYLSGALMSDKVVDPLLFELRRLNDNLERELTEKQHEAEVEKASEERKRLALVIADAVREDILKEIREEIATKMPAPMPATRKLRPTSDQ